MSVYDRLKALSKDSIVYAIPSVLQRSLGLITLPIFSRILTPEDYGIMGMMAAITCFLGMFLPTDWDAPVALCYHDAANERDRHAAVTSWLYFYFAVALVLASGLWLGSERIAATFLGSPQARSLLYLLAGSILLGTGTWPVAWTLLRIQKRKCWVMSILTGYLVLNMALSLLFVVVFRRGVQGVYLGGFLASIPLFLVSVWVIRFWLSPGWFSQTHLRKLLVVGLPYLPVTISVWLTGSLNRFFLEHYRGLGDVGLLSIATSLAAGMGIMVLAFQQAWWPFVIALKDDPDEKPVYAQALTSYLLISCSAATGLAVLAPELLSVLTPKRYHAVAPVVGYTAMTAVATGVCSIAALGITLSKKTSLVAWVAAITAAVAVLLNVVLIPRLGITGAALSSLLAQSTSAGLLFVFSQRFYFIAYRWRQGAIILLTAAFIGLGARFETEHLWLTVTLKACWLSCFPLLMLGTGVVTTGQVRRLMGRAQCDASSSVLAAELERNSTPLVEDRH